MNYPHDVTSDPMQCGKCRSHQTATFQMAHAQGSQSGRISGTVYEYDGGVEWHSGNVQMQSPLAQATAPPTAPGFWNFAVWLGFFVSVFLTAASFLLSQAFKYYLPFLARLEPLGRDPIYRRSYISLGQVFDVLSVAVFFLCLIAVTKLRNPSFNKERKIFENQLADWQHSVICLRCGNTWPI